MHTSSLAMPPCNSCPLFSVLSLFPVGVYPGRLFLRVPPCFHQAQLSAPSIHKPTLVFSAILIHVRVQAEMVSLVATLFVVHLSRSCCHSPNSQISSTSHSVAVLARYSMQRPQANENGPTPYEIINSTEPPPRGKKKSRDLSNSKKQSLVIFTPLSRPALKSDVGGKVRD